MREGADVFEKIFEHLRDRGLQWVVALTLTSIGGVVAYWRARGRWRRREFLDRLNVSLNLLIDGGLLIRTLLEKNCEEIFLNSMAVREILRASGRTTKADPLLPLPKEDYWYYLNSVLNEISEKYSAGQIQRDLGAPVRSGTYLIALTFECAGDLKTRKIRAMVIRKELLLTLPEPVPRLSSPHHATRWTTLHQMKAAYATTPWKFVEIELCL